MLLGAPIGARELVGLQRQAMAAVLDRGRHYFDINLDVLWSTVTEDLPVCWPL